MHSTIALKHWSHHLHENMLALMHNISRHKHEHPTLANIILTLLAVGILTLLYIFAKKIPYTYPPQVPPYIPV